MMKYCRTLTIEIDGSRQPALEICLPIIPSYFTLCLSVNNDVSFILLVADFSNTAELNKILTKLQTMKRQSFKMQETILETLSQSFLILSCKKIERRYDSCQLKRHLICKRGFINLKLAIKRHKKIVLFTRSHVSQTIHPITPSNWGINVVVQPLY